MASAQNDGAVDSGESAFGLEIDDECDRLPVENYSAHSPCRLQVSKRNAEELCKHLGAEAMLYDGEIFVERLRILERQASPSNEADMTDYVWFTVELLS